MEKFNALGKETTYNNNIIAEQTITNHPISKLIKEKAHELRGAGPESEFLIVSEMMQVDKGMITDPTQVLEIETNFRTLSEYKNQLLGEYRSQQEDSYNSQ